MGRTRRDLALLSDPAVRRFVLELLAVLFGTTVVFVVAVAPWLHGALPELFPRPLLVDGYDRGDLPRTRLGWLNWLVLAVVVGSFYYWRAYHTDLGREAVEAVYAVYGSGDPSDRE